MVVCHNGHKMCDLMTFFVAVAAVVVQQTLWLLSKPVVYYGHRCAPKWKC